MQWFGSSKSPHYGILLFLDPSVFRLNSSKLNLYFNSCVHTGGFMSKHDQLFLYSTKSILVKALVVASGIITSTSSQAQ